MFDPVKLLGSIAENLSTSSAPNRFGAAVQQGATGGGAQPGGLNSLLSGLMAQGGPPGSQPAAGGLGGLLGSFADMAARAASSPRHELQNNNPAAVGGLGSLAGALLGGGRGAMGGGLMAVLGSLAYSAMQNHAGAATSTPQPGNAGFGQMQPTAVSAAPNSQADVSRRALLLTRAMIQAAKADGVVDQQELQRIMGKLDDHGQDGQAREFVASEMRRPIDIGGLVRDVATPQEAAEVYAASLMAIEVDTQAERDYMADLAGALKLPHSVVSQIHSTLGIAV